MDASWCNLSDSTLISTHHSSRGKVAARIINWTCQYWRYLTATKFASDKMTRCSVIKILPTNSTTQSPSWEPASSSASKGIAPFIGGQCSLPSSQQPASCFSLRARSIQSTYSYFTSDSFYYYLDIRMRSSTWDHEFSPSKPLHVYRLPHICYA